MRSLLSMICISMAIAVQALAQSGAVDFEQILHQINSGAYQEAERALSQAPDHPYALRLRLELAERGGRQSEQKQLAERLLSLYRAGSLQTSEELSQAAYAAWKLQQWERANQIFMEAARRNPVSRSMYVDWGHLYLEKYNAAEAESIFQDAIASPASVQYPPRWTEADARLGLARALRDQSKPGSREIIEQLASEAPDNLELIAYQAASAVEEDDWDKASELIERGLSLNPGFLPFLELRAAREYFLGNEQGFEQRRSEVFAVNPRDADFYELLGDLAVSKRRFEDAVDFYDQAVQMKPDQWSALASKGINLLRLGEEEAGKEALERAYEGDPYNIWTVNTLRLIDSFDRFDRFESLNFSIKLAKTEAQILRPYVESLLEECLNELQQKYQFTVSHKINFEMYPDHEDFAVRTLGLPGLGALGATFGRVVAMDSPSARPKGEFHWASTLWHEVAHVVTLGMTDQKVPRWFSEGLSMMEERLGGPGWGDRLSPGFVEAYRSNQLLPLEELNSGFLRPRTPQQLPISYYQAGWVCEFLVKEFGFDAIRRMLKAYAEDKTTEEVFQEVLGLSVEEVDTRFKKEVARTLDPLLPVLERKDRLPDGALAMAARANPDHYWTNLAYGKQLVGEKKFKESVEYLERAIKLFPHDGTSDGPYPALVAAYEELGDEERLLTTLRKWWEQAPLFSENALRIADMLEERGQVKEAAEYLEQSMFVDPSNRQSHQRLGETYLAIGEPEKAIREFSLLLHLEPVDRANAHYWIARALQETGKTSEARKHVLLSLEVAPGFEQAQKLLLELVRQ
ncbi:MAG TPA: tetratricopeptide repeat protein [Acidobacteriota bacterium]|nr:tetratricopeptide repeat protein [Acidobacteriota bacterium]